MESRSPSNGIRSSMYSSILTKEAKTPCSLSLCSHNKLRRGTNRMWKSLDECILSSLKSKQSRVINTVDSCCESRFLAWLPLTTSVWWVITAVRKKVISHYLAFFFFFFLKLIVNSVLQLTCTHSQQWCPWAPAWDGQRRWCFWHRQRGACHFWGWTFFPLHVPWKNNIVETVEKWAIVDIAVKTKCELTIESAISSFWCTWSEVGHICYIAIQNRHIEFLPSEESTGLLVQKGQLDIRPKLLPKREKSL